MFLDQVIHFGEILGDHEKDRSPKKLKSLMDIPEVAHLKLQVLSINMNLVSSPKRIPRPSYPFGGKVGRSGKGPFPEKLKSLLEVPYLAHLKVQVLSYNMTNVFSP